MTFQTQSYPGLYSILVIILTTRFCSLIVPLCNRSVVMLFDHKHRCFRNFYFVVSTDVIRMNSYVDGFFNLTRVIYLFKNTVANIISTFQFQVKIKKHNTAFTARILNPETLFSETKFQITTLSNRKYLSTSKNIWFEKFWEEV